MHDLGVDITLDPAATMMFAMNANRREPLADGEDYGEARNLSPGVLLRPLWQDACLPTIGFVVGPGELSYLSAVAPLYRLLGVPQPVFVPRWRLVCAEDNAVDEDVDAIEEMDDDVFAKRHEEHLRTMRIEVERLKAEEELRKEKEREERARLREAHREANRRR